MPMVPKKRHLFPNRKTASLPFAPESSGREPASRLFQSECIAPSAKTLRGIAAAALLQGVLRPKTANERVKLTLGLAMLLANGLRLFP